MYAADIPLKRRKRLHKVPIDQAAVSGWRDRVSDASIKVKGRQCDPLLMCDGVLQVSPQSTSGDGSSGSHVQYTLSVTPIVAPPPGMGSYTQRIFEKQVLRIMEDLEFALQQQRLH